MESLSKNIRSLDMWSRIMRANTFFQNKGLLQIEINLNDAIKKEDLPKIKLLQITVLIKYEVTKPTAGLKFHIVECDGRKKICIYNENKVYTEIIIPTKSY